MAATEENQDDLKKKLVRRIGIAGVLIVVLLGGLALLEDVLLDKPAAPPAPTVATAVPPPAEAPKAQTPPAEEKPEADRIEVPKEEPKAEPERTETPLAPPVQGPQPRARVVIKPPAAAPGPQQTKSAAPAGVEHAAATEASARPVTKPDPATLMVRSYRLQMGVFTHAGNAEDLRARLERAGIPAYIESRVQAGPFETRQEAEAARRKLKALGLGSGLLIPPQKR